MYGLFLQMCRVPVEQIQTFVVIRFSVSGKSTAGTVVTADYRASGINVLSEHMKLTPYTAFVSCILKS